MRHLRAIRTIVLPQGIKAGPGQTNMRLDPGATCTVEDHCGAYERFLANRIQVGDAEWVAGDEDGAPTGTPIPSPNRSTSDRLGLEVGRPPERK